MAEPQRNSANDLRPGVAGPPPAAGGAPPGAGHNAMSATTSGIEGREELLGKAVALAIRTLKDTVPYQHEMNDATAAAAPEGPDR